MRRPAATPREKQFVTAAEAALSRRRRTAAVGTRRSERVSKPPFDTYLATNEILAGPEHTSAGWAGGAGSWVVLGPGASKLELDSDSVSTKPAAMMSVKKRYPREVFYSGHLINAAWWGKGEDPKNLTILLSRANTAHKNQFENRVRDAVVELRAWHRFCFDHFAGTSEQLAVGIKVGIKVEVTPSESKWTEDASEPGRFVCRELICNASLWGSVLDRQAPFLGLDHRAAAADLMTEVRQAVRALALVRISNMPA